MESFVILAEVCDKMPTLREIATISGALALISAVGGCFRWWAFAVLALPVLPFGNIGLAARLVEPGFGPVIWKEMGARSVYGEFFALNVPYVVAGAIAAAIRRYLCKPTEQVPAGPGTAITTQGPVHDRIASKPRFPLE